VTSVHRVAPGIWRAGTRWVNWYLLDAGTDGVVVIDAGLPRYDRTLTQALHDMGRTTGDISAGVLTHGHIDHIGMAPAIAELGVPIYLHPADTTLAADPKSNTTDAPLLPYLRYPATLGFVIHAGLNGALRPRPMPTTTALDPASARRIPGQPRVIHTPGHTSGSCVLHFEDHGAVFVGDLLCTSSPITGRRVDPQVQTRGSNRDSAQTIVSLDLLVDIEAPLVLPGHGGPWHRGIEPAIASARAFGCR
jgi:glyoxylase-like metal-dependent hydrolase (beta-lactamase superfamily II)